MSTPVLILHSVDLHFPYPFAQPHPAVYDHATLPPQIPPSTASAPQANLNGDEHDDRPLEEQSVLLAQSLTKHRCDLRGIYHLLVENFDSDADVQCTPNLVVVVLKVQFVA